MSGSEITRRAALATGGAWMAAAALPQTSPAARRRRNPVPRGGDFSGGVAAGAPRTDGALIWTRCDGVGKAKLRYEVAEDPGFRRVVRRGLAQATPVRDQSARLAVRGLRPGRPYWYRFETRTEQSDVGRFRTLRPADSDEPVRFAWFSCQRAEHGWFTPHGGIADDEDLDLVLSLGDYIYEEDSDPRIPERVDRSGRPNGHVETLDQFRARHRFYRADPNLQRMHAAHAVVPIWDDCEVEGNWAGERESSGGNPSGPRSIPFALKRLYGWYAYFESMPVERPRGADRFKVYRSVPLGGNAELLMLDTRQFRSPQPCGDATVQSGRPATCSAEYEDPSLRRLGDVQMAWLRERLRTSTAAWKVLGNAQMMMALDFPSGVPVESDSWNAYAAERRRVLEAALADGVSDLVSIVGDVHAFLAGDLFTDGRTTGRRVGTEFVGASVSHDALNLPGVPPDVSSSVLEGLPAPNPHLKYAQFRNRGYAVAEARPDALDVTFRAVDTVMTRTALSRDLARFRVGRGTNAVQRLL